MDDYSQLGIIFFEILIIFILLLVSGLVSASEVAFFSLKPADKENLKNKNDWQSQYVIQWLEKPEKLLATILILNNLVNITIVILSSHVTATIVNPQFHPLIVFLLQVVVVSFVILVIGEIVPKIFAIRNSLRIVRLLAFPYYLVSAILWPIIYPLLSTTNFVNRRLKMLKPTISLTDLSNALQITSSSLQDEKDILEGIVKFGNIEVSQIMRPRVDIVSVSINANFKKLMSVVIESGYSRIPVYEENIDNIKGIIIAKDLLPYIDEKPHFHWQGLIKPAFFVPENKKIDDLLADFQKNKMHLAIVVDEHGGTLGLVTMEDILEEVVGEIEDESDVGEEILYKKLSANTWLFEGKILLNDFFKVTGIEPDSINDVEGNFETLAGLILELKGEIPNKGDKIQYKNFTFIIESVDKRRIRQVKLIIQ